MKKKNHNYDGYEQLTILIDDPEVQKGIQSQQQYCKNKKIPLFIPSDGVCYNCKRNIFVPGGYTNEQAQHIHITGCPFCHTTFCD